MSGLSPSASALLRPVTAGETAPSRVPNAVPKTIPAADLAGINAYLSKHGSPRRFPIGIGTDKDGIRMFLRDRGYELKNIRTFWTVSSGRGRPKTFAKWSQVITFVDELRQAEGLQTIKAPQ